MGMNFGTGAGFNCPRMMDDNQSPQDNTLRSILLSFLSLRPPPEPYLPGGPPGPAGAFE